MDLGDLAIVLLMIIGTIFWAISGYIIVSGDNEAARRKKAKKAKALANKNLSGES
jgi:hypothetical protein